jgi:hypothetical protein
MFLLVVNIIILLIAGNFMEPTGIILILAPICSLSPPTGYRPDSLRHHHGGEHGDRHGDTGQAGNSTAEIAVTGYLRKSPRPRCLGWLVGAVNSWSSSSPT